MAERTVSSSAARRPPGKRQRGAVAIEFAALFALFFTLVYRAIAYSVPMLLTLTFQHLAADGARAAIRVDPALAESDYSMIISREVTAAIDAGWLPRSWFDGNCPAPDSGYPWQSLPASDGHPSYGHLARQDLAGEKFRYLLHVCVQRKYNSGGSPGENAIIPVLNLGVFEIPSLPSGSDGETVLRGRTVIRL
ncbi:MAG: hypothetical protein WC247_05145 [Porticoccaceae bacterium]